MRVYKLTGYSSLILIIVKAKMFSYEEYIIFRRPGGYSNSIKGKSLLDEAI